jgi:hypothetical protein
MLLLGGGVNFSGSGYDVNLNGLSAGTGYDQLNVTGLVSLTTNVPLTLSVGFQPQIGNKFTIVQNDGVDALALGGLFTSNNNMLGEGDTVLVSPFHQFTISYHGGDGNDVELTYLVPEPGSAALLLGGMAAMCARRRRKHVA